MNRNSSSESLPELTWRARSEKDGCQLLARFLLSLLALSLGPYPYEKRPT